MRPALPLLVVLALLAATLPSATAFAEDGFTAEFEADSVVVDDAPREVTLNVTGTDGNVTVSSPDVNDSTLAAMVGGTRTDGGVTVRVPEDGRIPVTVPARFECATGRYTFSLSDGTATADASINVVAPAEAETVFAGSVTGARAGGTARVGLAIDRCAGIATVGVGSSESSLWATVTLVPDGPGDAAGTLLVDTGNLTGDGAFSTTGNVSVERVTWTRTPNGTLAPGEYDLSLSSEGEETDVAVLVVEDATPAPTPTPRAVTTTPVQSSTPSPATTPSPTPTPLLTDTTAGGATPSSTAASGPGVGVAVALLAVGVVGLLVRRIE